MIKKTKKIKKDKLKYDENGRWVEERGRIKGAIRRAFRLAPQMKETIDAARVELSPALKKDGTPGKRNRVRFKCAMCGELFSQKNIQVDHIHTVVPLWKKEKDMTYDEVVRGVFCDKSNLQVLCSTPMIRNEGKASCHKKKTDEEKWMRTRWFSGGLKYFRWTPDKTKEIDGWLNAFRREYYEEHLKEKEEKENARKERKSRKRKRNSTANKKD